MSEYINFRNAVQKNFDKLAKNGTLYYANVSKQEVWDMYQNSFPTGTNEIFRERREHECNCCKHALNVIGRVVGEVDGEFVNVWEGINTGTHYDAVAKALSELLKSSKIAGVFLHNEREVGKDHTFEIQEDGKTIRWDHFHQVIPPSSYMKVGMAEAKGSAQTNKSVLERSLKEITEDAVDTVLELIAQNSIYRGAEHKFTVTRVKELKKDLAAAKNKELFLWKKAFELKGASSLRNTVIGTLLVDLSEGVELEKAVKTFESKVAPQNYKRSTALVTDGMRKKAKETAQELGLEPSFQRRFANVSDINMNDILFADNAVKPFMESSIFDAVQVKGPSSSKTSFDGVKSMSIEEFMKTVVPGSETIELFVGNEHEKNLMSLIAPVNASAPNIMKWNNNFSWTYNGDITDSDIRTRVKAAGGVVDAPFRISMSWHHRDDLDIHLYRKDRIGVRDHVYFGNREGAGAKLDVDMRGERYDQIENIFWKDLSKLPAGDYEVQVNNFRSGSAYSQDPARVEGFQIETEYLGNTFVYTHPNKLTGTVSVMKFAVDKQGNVDFGNTKFSGNQKEIWGVKTQDFQKVNMLMLSPNHWNGQEIGNKHYFFIVNDCKNPDSAVGFYNEFLIQELNPHRKVFEILSSALKAPHSIDQLSGFGFSSTRSDEVVIRVDGKRVVKVVF